MAEFHFVADYEKLVKDLKSQYPIDEAMSRAVGGGYEKYGEIECNIVCHFGLKERMSIIDLGCGSGRLATAVSKVLKIEYLGTDVVQDLLDYAKTRSPDGYRFVLNRALNIPAVASSADFVSAFSVFTHLLQPEIYLYMQDSLRVLRLGGRLVFSFLELDYPLHWTVFESTVANHRSGTPTSHLNTFIDRNQIVIWCKKLGFVDLQFFSGDVAPWGGNPLGQSLAVMTKGT